jgi:tetratricopeptide (TPR) repeat protein
LAAQVAQNAHAPTETAKHLGDAVTAARRLGIVNDEELTTVFMDLGWALELVGEYVRADNAYSRAALVSKPGPSLRAQIADRRAYIRSEYLGQLSAAIRVLHLAERRIETLDQVGPEVDRARAQLLAREAEVRMRQGRLSVAVQCSKKAAAEAERTGEKRSLAVALYVLDASLLNMGRIDEATHLRRVLELYEELEDHQQIPIALNNLAAVAFFASKWEEAATHVVQAANASIQAGDLAWAAIMRGNLAEIRVSQGRLDEARELLSAARRTLESFGYRHMAAAVAMHLGRTLAFLGDAQGGVDLVRAATDTFDEIGASVAAVEARARLAEVLVFCGRLSEAETSLEEARELERAASDNALGPLIDRVELCLAVASGDSTTALGRLTSCLDRARQMGASYDLLVELSLAEQLGIDDNRDEAARLRRDLGIVRLPMLSDSSSS